jgi:transposase
LRRYPLVRRRTRIKNEARAILHVHLVPKCPSADLFNRPGQALRDDEREAIGRHLRELDRLGGPCRA